MKRTASGTDDARGIGSPAVEPAAQAPHARIDGTDAARGIGERPRTAPQAIARR